jgi:hypothetical protein
MHPKGFAGYFLKNAPSTLPYRLSLKTTKVGVRAFFQTFSKTFRKLQKGILLSYISFVDPVTLEDFHLRCRNMEATPSTNRPVVGPRGDAGCLHFPQVSDVTAQRLL